jgi:hypothetical protein
MGRSISTKSFNQDMGAFIFFSEDESGELRIEKCQEQLVLPALSSPFSDLQI